MYHGVVRALICAPMAVNAEKYQRGKVVFRKDYAKDLWTIRVAPEKRIDFEPGQYVTVGLPDSASGKMIERAKELPPEVLDARILDETFVDAICDPPEVFTYGGMVAHVLTFAAHRRTLVCGALHDAGVTDLGAGDPMRWVATAA